MKGITLGAYLTAAHNARMNDFDRFLCEPVWRPVQRLRRSAVPEKYLSWLLDPASLTQRIISICNGTFRVQVISQVRSRPMLNEARALDMRSGAFAVVRQVCLLCNETPWVYARTIIPSETLTGRQRRLAHLRSRSLGALLFSDPSMQRGVVEVTRLSPCDKLFPLVTQSLRSKPETVWGRRSLFRIGGKPLLVSEFFLPDINKCPA